MNADAPQTTAEWLRETAENFNELWADDSFRMDFTDALAEAAAEVKALAAQNGALAEALVDIAEGEKTSYLACPGPPNCDRSHYPTCPVSIARAALSGQPADTEAERLRELLEAVPNMNDGLMDEPTPGGYHLRASWVLNEWHPWLERLAAARAALSGEARERRG